jgi:hypothetical protein
MPYFDQPKYLIKAFDTCEAAEQFANEQHRLFGYRVVSIADTNRCITIALERK